jgi:hypothetical protein
MRALDATRRRRGRQAALGVVLLAAVVAGLTACALRTAGGAGAGAPPPAARGSLAGQSTPTTTPQSAADAGSLGTIAGDVVAGPTCPVESIEDPCAPKPVPDRKVLILTPGGAIAATTTTDANGRFSVRVAPGSYTVRAEAGPGKLGLNQVSPGDVTVRAGATATVRIELDTGIR